MVRYSKPTNEKIHDRHGFVRVISSYRCYLSYLDIICNHFIYYYLGIARSNIEFAWN